MDEPLEPADSIRMILLEKDSDLVAVLPALSRA